MIITLEKYNLIHQNDFIEFIKEFQQYGDEFEMLSVFESILACLGVNKKYNEITEEEIKNIFSRYIEFCKNAEKYETLEKKEWVEADFHAICRDGKMIGEMIFRKRLSPFLLKHSAGHISYKIKHTERKKGYGDQALKLLLEKCWKDGYTELMIGCKENNIASSKLIEKNGGIFNRLNILDDGEIEKEYWFFKFNNVKQ